MSNNAKVFSEIKNKGGVPTLFVNGEEFPSVAYMTYLEKFNEYDDFAAAGYDFFSVPVLFSGRWISITDGLTPFKRGIFDKKGVPDYSVFDETIEKILAVCPDAYIIPRVNITMPVWWENENPDAVNLRADGTSARESFHSAKWRNDAKMLLREFVQYVNSSKYAPHIIGYHIAGGNTEEWFHYDLNGGYCKNAEPGFKAFLEKYYPETPFEGLPDISKLKGESVYLNDEYLSRFLEYSNFIVADSICSLASAVKEETNGNVVVGAFYGYTLEVVSPLHGTHALNILLKDKNIDFISSPNSYIGIRSFDCDWTEMYPADSLRLHGKMCFQECDIRTHLTKLLSKRDPSTDPNVLLSGPIWEGVKSKEQARNLIRKSFCRQLIKGNGLWWFDMWGGWYHDDDIMSEMKQFKEIYTESLKAESRQSIAEVAVFVDESAYKYLSDCPYRNTMYNQRKVLGLMGTPYDMYDVFDFAEVCGKYKAVIFISEVKTENMLKALEICREKSISYLMSTTDKPNFSVKELRSFCKSNGVFTYCETGDIIYINNNYFAICAQSGGEKTVKLPKKYKISELSGNSAGYSSDTLKFYINEGETKLFSLK